MLSTSDELNLRLRWTAVLSHQVSCDIAVTGGVHTGADLAKTILAGANAAMMTSAVLRNGFGHIRQVLDEFNDWADKKGYESLDAIRGILSFEKIKEPAAYMRANYMKTMGSSVDQ